MTPDFDVIVVGSGPAGVSVAFPLVEAGLRVLMVDGGKQPSVMPPEKDFLSVRTSDAEQWKWMIGEDFYALKMRDAVSPKLRVPPHAYVFDGFAHANQIARTDFIAVGSLAKGGLSNAWGCGVARFSDDELGAFPFSAEGMDASYAKVSSRIGISGRVADDLSDYFGLDSYAQPPIPMDALHIYLSRRYESQREKLHSLGFNLGRSRVAALSEDMSARKACNLSGNCLWGCSRHSLYSAMDELPVLRRNDNFSELSGFVVDDLSRIGGRWVVNGQSVEDGERASVSASRVILAAGTLATTRLVLKTLNHRRSVPVLSSPTSAFLLWLPRFLGEPRGRGFALGQLSFSMSLDDGINAFGSTFSTTGIPLAEFARHMPLGRRYGIDLLRGLLSSCVVGNLFLPGNLTLATAQLGGNGDVLHVSGKYSSQVMPVMAEARRKLSRIYRSMGALLLPGSFTVGRPGGDIHYAGTLPMREEPSIGETSFLGEVKGMEGVHVVDGAALPILSAKSHTLTIMANADRIGRLVASQH